MLCFTSKAASASKWTQAQHIWSLAETRVNLTRICEWIFPSSSVVICMCVCVYVCRFKCGFCRKQAQPKGAVIRVVTFEFENRSGTLGISTSRPESGDGNVRCLGKKRSIKQTWLLISLPSRCYRWDMETHSDLWTDRENMLNHISSSCGADEHGASRFPEWISTTMTRLLAFELAVKNQF